MLYIPIRTGVLEEGDDIAQIVSGEKSVVSSGDIVVVSSKVIATIEGAVIDLSKVHVSNEAKKLSKQTGLCDEFCQAILDETKKWNGKVIGHCPQAVLTELKPDGLSSGTILVANAGLDLSNVKDGFAVGWPEDPVESVGRLRKKLIQQMSGQKPERSSQWAEVSGQNSNVPTTDHSPLTTLAVILSDSCCSPRRIGVTAIALAVSGIDPIHSKIGAKDLFDKELNITKEAVADQLATAANALMGNGGEGIPAVIIRDHEVELSDFEGWVPGIKATEDLFGSL